VPLDISQSNLTIEEQPMAPTNEQKLLFVKFANDAINNSHVAIKNCWLIFFSAATFHILSTIRHSFACAELFVPTFVTSCIGGDAQYYTIHSVENLLYFTVYLLTFFRFYVGDVRIFDIRYSEMFKIAERNIEQSIKANRDNIQSEFNLYIELVRTYGGGGRHKFESFYLMLQTLLIVSIGINIDNAIVFGGLYSALLLVNAVWLSFTPHKMSQLQKLLFLSIPLLAKSNNIKAGLPSEAGKKWIVNNFAHGAALGVIIVLVGSGLVPHQWLWAAVIVALSNCIFDILMTFTFYFPNFLPDAEEILKAK
jgi:hypothetical protein